MGPQSAGLFIKSELSTGKTLQLKQIQIDILFDCASFSVNMSNWRPVLELYGKNGNKK